MLKKLQEEHKPWSDYNFGEQPAWVSLMGVVEEVGELCHSELKTYQNIRNNENHKEKAKDAVADIVIFLANYCNVKGFDFEQIVKQTWEQVKQRDWKKHPDTGHEKETHVCKCHV